MKFWIDMDNAPHVHVLAPIIRELRYRGHEVEITARDYGQTLPLLEMYGLKYKKIGRHAGGNRYKKYISLLTRSIHLLMYALGKRFDAALCHGSRALFPAARFLNIPLIVLGDYEYTEMPRFMCRWLRILLIPDVIPPAVFAVKGVPLGRILGYPGLKEDLYVHEFQPDQTFLDRMKIDKKKILLLIRPPATMAHYAVRESETFFYEMLDYLFARNDLQLLLLPRTNEQGKEIRAYVAKCKCSNTFFVDRVYNGPNLIWHSDLVISGGGTMNREAASLGVPVLSIYQGPLGSVDRHLIEAGRLIHVSSMEEFLKIPLIQSDRNNVVRHQEAGIRVRDFIIDRILESRKIASVS